MTVLCVCVCVGQAYSRLSHVRATWGTGWCRRWAGGVARASAERDRVSSVLCVCVCVCCVCVCVCVCVCACVCVCDGDCVFQAVVNRFRLRRKTTTWVSDAGVTRSTLTLTLCTNYHFHFMIYAQNNSNSLFKTFVVDFCFSELFTRLKTSLHTLSLHKFSSYHFISIILTHFLLSFSLFFVDFLSPVLQVEQAEDATDKRKQMEAEKEVTSDLVEKYKVRETCL